MQRRSGVMWPGKAATVAISMLPKFQTGTLPPPPTSASPTRKSMKPVRSGMRRRRNQDGSATGSLKTADARAMGVSAASV